MAAKLAAAAAETGLAVLKCVPRNRLPVLLMILINYHDDDDAEVCSAALVDISVGICFDTWVRGSYCGSLSYDGSRVSYSNCCCL